MTPKESQVFSEEAAQVTFMRASGQTTKDINMQQFALYVTLMEEEIAEFTVAYAEFLSNPEHNVSALTEVIDGLLDIVVTAKGGLYSLGVPMLPAIEEVWKSNLTKISLSGLVEKRADGKVLKPAGYLPPNLKQFNKLYYRR